MKTIKIPKGQFRLLFENYAKESILTDDMLLSFITEGVLRMTNAEPTERNYREPLSYEDVYDDTDPNYIRQSQEEI